MMCVVKDNTDHLYRPIYQHPLSVFNCLVNTSYLQVTTDHGYHLVSGESDNVQNVMARSTLSDRSYGSTPVWCVK